MSKPKTGVADVSLNYVTTRVAVEFIPGLVQAESLRVGCTEPKK